jgi:hypothetical protein
MRELAEAVQRFLNASPGMPATLLYVSIAAIPVILVHELGHALMAARRLGAPVHVSVGATGRLLRVHFRRLTMAVNALPHPHGLGGYATFDASRASAFDLLLVALAGPAASLCSFALAALALATSPAAGVVHDVLWAATLDSLAWLLLNIVPLEVQERREGPKLRTDGLLALQAMRAVRAFRGL